MKPDIFNTATERFLVLYRARVCNASSLKAIVGLILEDPGSKVKFNVHVFAKKMKLQSEPVTTGIEISGEGCKAYQSHRYTSRWKTWRKRSTHSTQ